MDLNWCLWWALKQQRRYGGWVRYRQSKHWWFPHYLWVSPGPPWHPAAERGEMFEMVPAVYVPPDTPLILPPMTGVWYVHKVTPESLYAEMTACAWEI